jgi:hypothetical protein
VKITADTITDDQLRELRRKARASMPGAKHESRSELLGLIETCDLALGESVLQRRADVHAYARASCAAILNDRSAT